MTIRVTFANTESRDAFASRFKLTSSVDSCDLDIPLHLLNFVKSHEHVTNLSSPLRANVNEPEVAHQFIVTGDLNTFSPYCEVSQDLTNGFYLVSTSDPIELANHVTSIEIVSQPMQFLESNIGSITGMNSTETSIDPTSSAGQWARIRVASRYRPLLSSFAIHDINYQSRPELIIMDSGINFNHPEFQYDSLETENFYTLPNFNGNFEDDVGHGTAVAACAVGKNLGVAEYCTLVNVKIGSANYSANLIDVGMAIDAILTRVAANPNKTRVVNMSWGIPRSSWLDAKVQSLIDAGVTVICAAGNQGISVEDISPAGLDTVITVGSVDKFDIPSGFNNISPTDVGLTTGMGLSLDIFAPGENVLVADALSNGYKLGSGTSFSAPMVAGVAIVIASINNNTVFYNEIKDKILTTATEDALLFEDDTFSDNQNRLLFLFTSDLNGNYKNNNMTSYLGIHNESGEPIVIDINSIMDKSSWSVAYPNHTFTYSVEFLDPTTEAEYGPFINCDPTTGMVTIEKPTVVLPEETRLKMVEFVGVLQCEYVKMSSYTLFFFYNNPLYLDTLQSDVTLALTNTNSISFYANWGTPIK